MGSIPHTPTKTKNPALRRDFLVAPLSRKLFSEKIPSGNLSPSPRRRNHFRLPVRTFVPELTRKLRASLIIHPTEEGCQRHPTREAKKVCFLLYLRFLRKLAG